MATKAAGNQTAAGGRVKALARARHASRHQVLALLRVAQGCQVSTSGIVCTAPNRYFTTTLSTTTFSMAMRSSALRAQPHLQKDAERCMKTHQGELIQQLVEGGMVAVMDAVAQLLCGAVATNL